VHHLHDGAIVLLLNGASIGYAGQHIGITAQ